MALAPVLRRCQEIFGVGFPEPVHLTTTSSPTRAKICDVEGTSFAIGGT